MSILSRPIEFLKGVGTQKAGLLSTEIGIHTFSDLLFYFPFRYNDKSVETDTTQLHHFVGEHTMIRGVLTNLSMSGFRSNKRLEGRLVTKNNQTIQLLWFQGGEWIQRQLHIGTEYICYGKLGLFDRHLQLSHPEMESYEQWVNNPQKFQPVYSTTEKLKRHNISSKSIENLQKQLALLLEKNHIPENLPHYIVQRMKLLSRHESLKQIHAPTSIEALGAAQKRLKVEEILWFQLSLAYHQKTSSSKMSGPVFQHIGDLFNSFYDKLPFSLTNAQKRVLKEIRTDCKNGKAMYRLLQGDVGSGKTIVALMSMLMAVDNGYQACLVAPTEILAQQHYQSILNDCFGLPIHIALLTGNTSTAQRKKLLEDLKHGAIHILVGTHALFEDSVVFKQMGLAIIDEQHRFGVEQRSRLLNKTNMQGKIAHTIVMTATPIPRTLAMTSYSDLDYSVIDELPAGRKVIKTVHRMDHQRILAYEFIKQQLDEGRQAYIVFPLIEESEKLSFEDLMTGYEQVKSFFSPSGDEISLVHGKMKKEMKDTNMKRFVEKKTKIMVATTVIEVGINVPNATIMMIESAEKFGLAQLHQLRGRVGRGADQSYCILLSSSKLSPEAKERMHIMCSTNDGFKIAEKDLELRGPGDVHGTRQSGELPFRLASLSSDKTTIFACRELVEEIIKNDPELESAENKIFKENLLLIYKKNGNIWLNIG